MNSYWFVLHVMTGKETDVAAAVRNIPEAVDALVPERIMKEQRNGKWKDIPRLLFPSYVFIRVWLDADMYYKIMDIPGIIRILGNDIGPVPVPEHEMTTVLMLGNSGKPFDISDVYYEGENIRVASGPLTGMEGQISKLDARRYRAKVNISIMGEIRTVELPINLIEKSET